MAFGTSLHAKATKHTVKKGESLYSIAHKNHITIDQLRKVNHLKKGTLLKAGKVITIPSRTTHIAKKTKKSKKRYAKTKKHHKKLVKVLSKKVSKFAVNDVVFTSRYATPKAKKMIQIAKRKLGKRYVWGATGSNAFDCSGLTTYVCKLNGIKLPRRAIAQSKVGRYVPRSQLKPGDLIFFDTSKHRRGYVNHVGIYIGNGKFIHASSAKHKVTITSLSKPFYSQRFKVARRVVR